MNKNMKRVMLYLMMSSMLTSLAGCSSKGDSDKSFVEFMEDEKKNTLLDEALKLKGISDEQVDELKKYIELSEKFKKLIFKRVETSNWEEYYDIGIDEITQFLASYDERSAISVAFREALAEDKLLTNYEKVINAHVFEGYQLMGDVALITAKVKMLDTLGLDIEYLDEVRVPNALSNHAYSYSDSYDTFSVYVDGDEYKVERGELLYNLIDNVYSMQENNNSSLEDVSVEVYNADRNKYISDAINSVYAAIEKEFYLGEEKFLFWSEDTPYVKTKKK